MDSNLSRRNFIKAAGTTAGFAIAAGYSPFTYAQNDKLNVGCIGTGGQGTFHIRTGMAGTPDIQIVAVCDVFDGHRRPALQWSQISNANILLQGDAKLTDEQKAAAKAALRPTEYYNHKEMLEKENLDAVVISTPLRTHFPLSMDCLDAGKFVFCEKTLVGSVEDGRALITKCNEVGKWLQVGHQRRYNPKYNLGMKIAYDNNQLGHIGHITAQWHRNEYWRRPLPEGYELNAEEVKYIPDLEKHLNWRMYEETSGGLYTELATHQTDVANWFLKSVPARVHAFSGLDYWKDGRTVDDNILLSFEYDMTPGSAGFSPIQQRSELQKVAALAKSYKVRFVYTSILMNAKRGASEIIQGDWGTLELTENDCYFYGEPAAATTYAATVSAEAASEAVTSGKSLQLSNEELTKGKALLADKEILPADVYQFNAFAKHIKDPSLGAPRNNQMVGYTTSLTSIAAQQSRAEGKTVEIDPAWYTFDFEVPSFYDYEYTEA